MNIAKGEKPGHFWEIKKIPSVTITKPEKEDMSGKTRTCGKPNLTFTNGKKIQRKKAKHRYKFGGANAPPIFFYLNFFFFFGSQLKSDKEKN